MSDFCGTFHHPAWLPLPHSLRWYQSLADLQVNDILARSAWRARQGRTAAHGAAVSGVAAECAVSLSLLVAVARKLGKHEAASHH